MIVRLTVGVEEEWRGELQQRVLREEAFPLLGFGACRQAGRLHEVVYVGIRDQLDEHVLSCTKS